MRIMTTTMLGTCGRETTRMGLMMMRMRRIMRTTVMVTCGRATMRMGLRKAAEASNREIAGPRYWLHLYSIVMMMMMI